MNNYTDYIFREAKIPAPSENIKKGSSHYNWGDDNLYPQFLLYCYYNSSIHQGIVNSKIKYIASDGVDSESANIDLWNLIKKNGNAAFSLDEIIKELATDLELINSFAVIYKKNPISKFWDAHHVPIELIRKSTNEGYYEYSEDWKAFKQSEDKTGWRLIKSIEEVTATDNECMLYVCGKSKQHILNEDRKTLTKSVYPIPSYSGCITSILASIEINYFKYSEVVNGFKGGTLVNVPWGDPNDKAGKENVVKKLKGDASNRDTQGGLVVTFSKSQEMAPTVQQLNGNNLDQRYLLTKESIVDEIMYGHSVINPSLFGVKTAGQLGGSQELQTAYLIFMNNYASDRQKIITDAIEYANYTLNNFSDKIFFKIKPLELEQASDSKSIVADSLNKMSPLVANAVLRNLTINEQRALAGLTPLPNGDMLNFGTETPKIDDNVVLSWFNELGKKEYKEIYSQEIKDFNNLEFTEGELLKKYTFADLTTDQSKILEMINNGESYSAIVKALNQGATYISKQLIQLEKLGMIKGFEITSKGSTNIGGVQFEIVYQYRERIDAPALAPGSSSRPFCKNLIQLQRVFSRQEIDKISDRLRSSGIDRNVWEYKGGWYHNPETGINTPSCRHTWFQIVIEKK